jgi:uncharacterized membrane protein YoaK (UPF0700 family)
MDAVSVLGLGHVFTANMTGNVVFLGFALAGAPGYAPWVYVAALTAFLGGAVIGGRLGRRFDLIVQRDLVRKRRISVS